MSRRDPDPRGRYEISYKVPHPCLRPDRVPVQRMRVTGKQAMETTRNTLRGCGYTVISVKRTNLFT